MELPKKVGEFAVRPDVAVYVTVITLREALLNDTPERFIKLPAEFAMLKADPVIASRYVGATLGVTAMGRTAYPVVLLELKPEPK